MTGDVTNWVLPILPEIALLVLAVVILVLDAIFRDKPHRLILGWTSTIGLALIAGGSLLVMPTADATQPIWGGMLRMDQAAFVFRMVFLLGASITSLFAMESRTTGERGEFYLLMMVSVLGMSLMAASVDLIMLYLAIETTSIPLYVLAGFKTRDQKSVESGIKYLLFGAMTSAVMLFGFSFLYGFSGSTSLTQIAMVLSGNVIPPVLVGVVLLLVLVGFSFKISAVPFHFWAPDVYEGAPTPVAGFLSTASKAAGFAVLIRVMLLVFPGFESFWSILLAVVATASMFLGNLLALAQKNIKRLLAYSSIAQAGYILIGVVTGSQLGITGSVYYLLSYLLTNLAAFGIVTVVGRSLRSDEISAYAGLSRRSQGLSIAMLIALLSLAGIPPFAGFVGKLLVFGAAIQHNWIWLAIVGIINSVIGLYYYLTVLKVMFLYRSEDDEKPLPVAASWKVALVVCLVGVIVLGVILAPWYDISQAATLAFATP